MPRQTVPIMLSSDERKQLERWLSAMGTPQQVAVRCRIILCCAGGKSEVETAAENQVNRNTVRLWRKRFQTQGLQAVWQIAPGRGRKPVYDAARIKEVVDATLQSRPKGRTQWSCRTMA